MALSSYTQASSFGQPFSIHGDTKKEALVLTPLVSTIASSHSVAVAIQILEEIAFHHRISTPPACLFPPPPTPPVPPSDDPSIAPPPPAFDPATADPEVLVEMTTALDTSNCDPSALTMGILSIKDATGILASLPQTPATSHYLGLRLVDALVSVTKFENNNSAIFFRKRARWAVLEFCEESLSSETKLLRIPYTTLVRIGKCIYGVTLNKAGNPGEMFVNGGQKGTDVAREFSPGDNLIIQNLPPPHSQEGFQPTICECRVENARPLILAVVRKDDDQKLLAMGQGGTFRIDRVASRIVYTR